MTRAWLLASLALWTRRHKFRQQRLDAAHRRNDPAGIAKWHTLLAAAGEMMRRRRQQLAIPVIDEAALHAVVPALPAPLRLQLARDLAAAMNAKGITEPHACAHFVGQCAHESVAFVYTREIWGPSDAQKGYWKRRDLQGSGPLFPQLGWLTRGAGYIQTTGRNNFRRAAQQLGMSYARLLTVAGSRKYAALMAAAWWADHFPHDMSDWTVKQVTLKVNGGYNGLSSREKYTARAMEVKNRLVPR